MENIVNRVVAIIISPVFILFSLLISLTIIVVDRFWPIFIATRVGKGGKLFKCIKFQTLRPTNNTDHYMDPKKDQQRLTSLGRFLRNRGWDELPQIINIIQGDMNFIGPRPIPLAEHESLKSRYPTKILKIENWISIRQSVLPGLSGWHQVHLLDHNIIKYDIEYLETPSIWKKFIIITKSVLILIVGKGIFFGEKIPDTYVYDLGE